MRIVLHAPDSLSEWDALYGGVASSLLRVEGNRTLDQLWHRGQLTEDDLVQKRSRLNAFLPHLEILPLSDDVLDLAAQPLPTNLATLDAIHLASAILYRAAQPPDERPLVFATHDHALARAARAMNFEVFGVPA